MNWIIIINRAHASKNKSPDHEKYLQASIDWVAKMEVQQRAILLGVSDSDRECAGKAGLEFFNATSECLSEDLSNIATLKNASGLILSDSCRPFKEDWLLDSVEESMRQHPTKRTITKTRKYDSICYELFGMPEKHDFCVTGTLCGIPRDLLSNIDCGHTQQETDVIVHHHVEKTCYKPTSADNPSQENWLQTKVKEAAMLHRPVFLPNNVALVGSSVSMIGSNAGTAIDGHDSVIRVNWAKIKGFEQDVGSRMDYHSTKYFHTLMTDKNDFPDSKSVAIRWSLSKDPNRWKIFNYGATPFFEEEIKRIMGHEKFVTSGLCTLMWALIHGARHVSLAGFGGKEHVQKKNYFNDQKDVFAEKEWKHREDLFIDRLASEGIVSFLD